MGLSSNLPTGWAAVQPAGAFLQQHHHGWMQDLTKADVIEETPNNDKDTECSFLESIRRGINESQSEDEDDESEAYYQGGNNYYYAPDATNDDSTDKTDDLIFDMEL